METQCPQCGRPYGKRRRCYVCTGASRRTGEIRICKQCGKEFYAQRNQIADTARNSATYCSRDCRNANIPGNPGKPGETLVHSAGYLLAYAPDHPRASRTRVFEHILVAEQMLGRYLTPDEQVHHIDGNKTNNAPENLQVLTSSEHAALHAAANHPAVEATRVPVQCAECGKAFRVARYRTDPRNPQSFRKYCSLPCRHAAWARQMKARRAAKRAPPPKE